MGDQTQIQRLTAIEDEDVREAIASAMRELGLREEHLAAARVVLREKGYMEFGDESGAAPFAAHDWQAVEVRLEPLVLVGSVTRIQHAADGKVDEWVEASLTPVKKA